MMALPQGQYGPCALARRIAMFSVLALACIACEPGGQQVTCADGAIVQTADDCAAGSKAASLDPVSLKEVETVRRLAATAPSPDQRAALTAVAQRLQDIRSMGEPAALDEALSELQKPKPDAKDTQYARPGDLVPDLSQAEQPGQRIDLDINLPGQDGGSGLLAKALPNIGVLLSVAAAVGAVCLMAPGACAAVLTSTALKFNIAEVVLGGLVSLGLGALQDAAPETVGMVRFRYEGPSRGEVSLTVGEVVRLSRSLQSQRRAGRPLAREQVLGAVQASTDNLFTGSQFASESGQRAVALIVEREAGAQQATVIRSFPPLNGEL